MADIRTFQGHTPELGKHVYVDARATVIGKVSLGDDASIWPGAILRGDVERIEVGARSNLQDGVIVHVTHDGPYTPGGQPCIVGADVTVGHGAILHACTIDHTVLIGMHATVLDGVKIGPYAMIGAGALVAPGKQVGKGELWLGNPARKVRMLSDREIEQLAYSASHYVEVKNAFLREAQ